MYQIINSYIKLVIFCMPFLVSCTSNLFQSKPQVPFALEEATIDDIQSAYKSGKLTTVNLIQGYLDRINAYEKNGPRINSIIAVNPNVLKQAALLDAERIKTGPRSALHGIPVLLKDNIDTFDLPTTNGSAVLKGIIPPDDATLTRELREAGAIILGKAAMGEFASGSYNSISGQTINPYNFKRDTGGSSSGSAAAVAANFSVLAVGTDTSTSVRGPAAFNGIVGLRPTTGLISRDGIAPKDLQYDSAGPMARTVTDIAHMLSAIAVEDDNDPISKSVWNEVSDRYKVKNGHIDYSMFLDRSALNGKRIGVVRNLFGGDPEIDEMANEAIKVIQSLGGILVDINFDEDFISRYLGSGSQKLRRIADYRFRNDWEEYIATLPGAPKSVAEFVDIYETRVNKSELPARENVLRLLKTSLLHSTEEQEYQDLVQEVLPKATADKLAMFERYNLDILVFPYETRFAGVIKSPVYSLEDPTYVSSDIPSPATLAGYNSTGFPCIVVPMGIGSQGLPMGIAFFGKPYDEGPLLGYAFAYEQASMKRKPPPLLPPLKK
jgi:amidase